MESDLKSILSSNSVDEGLRAHLESSGCKSLKQFARWMDEKAEVKTVFLVGSGFEESREQLANLKSAWIDWVEL
eukprot:761884-Karenia_brevis.AAC.1